MSPTTTTTPVKSCTISEESYCAPWDLKIQEEKLKLLNEQHQISLSFNHKPFHRTYSARTSSRKKSFTHRELSPPVLPPFPLCQCTEKLDLQTIHSSIDTSHSFLFALKSPLNKCTQSSIQNNSLPKIQTNYEQPWDINNLHGRSLQKMPSTNQHCSSCRHSDDLTTIPIDRYFWYHYTMSRRQAENVLESRPSGSFLVRQSESGNQNDYSLSIKTAKGCLHMRICYSNGFYILGECSRPFSSVSCMIKYFSQTFVPIRGAEHIKLGTPVLRWEILSSSSLSNEEIL